MKRQNNLPMATLCQMATPQELRSLYLAISRRLHPDRIGGSTEAMQKLNAAYDAVKNGDEDVSYSEALLRDLRADIRDEYEGTAARWNERLADLKIGATVTPASGGGFTLTMYDVTEDEIAETLSTKIKESEIF
jgi:curved DNA-binding protein CbpA